ncbi:MAG: MarR family transcriptional regulator [Frankiales bacterium]|nr:MarR family transcriptional regulator [Frankiales bacterium]
MRALWESRGLPAPDHVAAMTALLRVHALMTLEIDRVLKGHGLTRTAYLVLVTLQVSRDPGRPLGQLSKHLLVHPTTVTLVIDQLEQAGLVVRRAHPSDRRAVLAQLTPEGRTAVDRATRDLAETGFGLGDVDVPLLAQVTRDLREVRTGASAAATSSPPGAA